MFRIYIIYILLFVVTTADAQPPVDGGEVPSNSLAKIYKQKNPALQYSYDQVKQIHNYSGNWDMDGDKKKDSIFFMGNGGAHLYFHLQVVLSSDKKTRDFLFLLTDMPLLDPVDSLKRKLTENLPFPKFVVGDFNVDGRSDVYLNVGPMDSEIPSKWKRKGVNSRHLVVTYENKDLTIKNYARIAAINK